MKSCIKCNEIKEEADYRPTRSGKSLSTVCIACVLSVKRAEAVVYRAKYKAKVRAAEKRYRAVKPEVYASAKARYYKKNPDVFRAERKRFNDRAREELRRGYLLNLLYRRGERRKAVPETLIDLKREQILNKRLHKQLENLIGEKNGKE